MKITKKLLTKIIKEELEKEMSYSERVDSHPGSKDYRTTLEAINDCDEKRKEAQKELDELNNMLFDAFEANDESSGSKQINKWIYEPHKSQITKLLNDVQLFLDVVEKYWYKMQDFVDGSKGLNENFGRKFKKFTQKGKRFLRTGEFTLGIEESLKHLQSALHDLHKSLRRAQTLLSGHKHPNEDAFTDFHLESNKVLDKIQGHIDRFDRDLIDLMRDEEDFERRSKYL